MTLSKQLPHNRHQLEVAELDEFLSTVTELSKKHKILIADVIAASRVLELKRTNDLYGANGDAFDEQIAGIGELIEKLASAVESLKGP